MKRRTEKKKSEFYTLTTRRPSSTQMFQSLQKSTKLLLKYTTVRIKPIRIIKGSGKTFSSGISKKLVLS